GIAPALGEAASIEGAGRWYVFRRVTFPLLMPTTLFVLINAVINSFRLVDHIVVMTRGGPDNASSLLLYYIYDVGFKFWDTAYAAAWNAAPFARYFVNTFVLVTVILAAQLVLCTLAAYAFARFAFVGRDVVFLLVLVQLMIMPDVLIVQNYRTMSALGVLDTVFAIGLPYMASAFGIFLLRQTFKTVPKELDEAARVEGAGPLETLWKVYEIGRASCRERV